MQENISGCFFLKTMYVGYDRTSNWNVQDHDGCCNCVLLLLLTNRMTACLENLERTGNLTAVREMSWILQKVWEMSGENVVTEKLPKTVYCKLHICVHTGI